MASPQIYATGGGGTTGDELATVKPLAMSGFTWYVSSATGTDAASPAGRERIKPLATLSQAYTNASAGDIIYFLSGHQEVLTAVQTISKAGLLLVGEGTGTNRPRFTLNASDLLFDITAAGVMLANLYFPASTVAPTPSRVRIAVGATVIRGCYFECGTLDTVTALQYVTGAGTALVADTTFASTSSDVASQPAAAITVTNAMSDLTLDTVTLDGGTSGWSNPYAFVGSAAITRLRATNLDLLRDSDVTVATGSVYVVNTRYTSGSARLVLTA